MVVVADVRHTVKNIRFSASVQKLLTLLFSPFTQTWLTIGPSKKCISHSEINYFFFNPFCPLSLHTFWHLVICVYIVYCSIQSPEIRMTWIINDITHTQNVTTITPHPPHLHTCTDQDRPSCWCSAWCRYQGHCLQQSPASQLPCRHLGCPCGTHNNTTSNQVTSRHLGCPCGTHNNTTSNQVTLRWHPGCSWGTDSNTWSDLVTPSQHFHTVIHHNPITLTGWASRWSLFT